MKLHSSNLLFSAVVLFGSIFPSISAGVTMSDPPLLDWDRRIEQASSLNALAKTESGGVYATGRHDQGCLTIAYAENGSVTWSHLIEVPEETFDWDCSSIAVDPNGNVFSAGYLSEIGFRIFWIHKYDSEGAHQWTKSYSGFDFGGIFLNAQIHDIDLDALGNFYATGPVSGSTSESGYDYGTVKLDQDGEIVWTTRYEGASGFFGDIPSRITVDSSGSFVYITGSSPNSTGDTDIVTVKYDVMGSVLWDERYSGPGSGDDDGFALAVDETGNVFVAGDSPGLAGDSDFITLKYAPDGKLLWDVTYDGPEEAGDAAYDIVVGQDGSAHVTGASWGGDMLWDIATVKYSSSGDELWVRRSDFEGESTREWGVALVMDLAGNLYVQGGGEGSDLITLKYSPDGDLAWMVSYDGPGNNTDYAKSIVLDNQCSIYGSGSSWGDGDPPLFEWALVKWLPQGDDAIDSDDDGILDSCDPCPSVPDPNCGNDVPEFDSTPAPGSTFNFGDVNVGETSPPESLLVDNLGTANLTLSCGLSGTHADQFNITACPTLVIPDGQVSITFTCTPSSQGAKTASLDLTTNDTDESSVSYTLNCSGVSPGPLEFLDGFEN